ncbi:MAG: hypothetical protein WAV41_03385 [Microgenomates group bacterium]
MKKIKANWVLSLPFGSKMKVKEGDTVVYGQELFEYVVEEEVVFGLGQQMRGIDQNTVNRINEENNNKNIELGDTLFEKSGWWGRKIVAPAKGSFNGIDQWQNLHLVVGSKTRKVNSPTEAVVGKIGEDKMILEFIAEEYLGIGLNDNKGWVNKGIKDLKKIADLNFLGEDKLVLMGDLDQSVLMKADVVGVGGIVVLDNDNLDKNVRINFKIPIIKVNLDTFERLQALDGSEVRSLIDGSSGRLLLMVTP